MNIFDKSAMSKKRPEGESVWIRPPAFPQFLQLEPALALGLEAGAAVDRAVTAGLERNLGRLAAAVADHVIHLTLATVGAAVGSAARRTASRATAGLVLEALVSIELLLRSGEHEFRAALAANHSLVFEPGYIPSSMCVPIRCVPLEPIQTSSVGIPPEG